MKIYLYQTCTSESYEVDGHTLEDEEVTLLCKKLGIEKFELNMKMEGEGEIVDSYFCEACGTYNSYMLDIEVNENNG